MWVWGGSPAEIYLASGWVRSYFTAAQQMHILSAAWRRMPSKRLFTKRIAALRAVAH